MKTEKEKMLAGEIYFANDKVLIAERTSAKKLLHKLNVTEYLMNGNARNILPQTDLYLFGNSEIQQGIGRIGK